MTEEEISKMKSDAVDEAFDKVFGCLFTLPLIALREEYGFGKKRLQVINDKMTDMLKEIEKDELDLNDLVKQMKEKYEITFRYEEGGKRWMLV